MHLPLLLLWGMRVKRVPVVVVVVDSSDLLRECLVNKTSQGCVPLRSVIVLTQPVCYS